MMEEKKINKELEKQERKAAREAKKLITERAKIELKKLVRVCCIRGAGVTLVFYDGVAA